MKNRRDADDRRDARGWKDTDDTRVIKGTREKQGQVSIDICFIGSRVCWSTLLHCCLAFLKVFVKGGYIHILA